MTTTNINVERLSTGSLIYVRDDFNAAAEVLDIEFDHDQYQYIISYGSEDAKFTTTVAAGETVEAFDHQTFLRPLDKVTFDEWMALNTVALARLDAALADAPVNLLDALMVVREGSDQLEAAE